MIYSETPPDSFDTVYLPEQVSGSQREGIFVFIRSFRLFLVTFVTFGRPSVFSYSQYSQFYKVQAIARSRLKQSISRLKYKISSSPFKQQVFSCLSASLPSPRIASAPRWRNNNLDKSQSLPHFSPQERPICVLVKDEFVWNSHPLLCPFPFQDLPRS